VDEAGQPALVRPEVHRGKLLQLVSNARLKAQGLVSVKDPWGKAQGYSVG
jgi:hypothetical protein